MRNKSGFTLIELLIIVVLMGIMAAIAIPRFSSNQRAAYTTAQKIVSDLRYTRSLAISSGYSYYLQFTKVNGSWQYAISDNLEDTRDIPVKTCTPSTNTFTFNYLGVCNTGTVTLYDGVETNTVTVVGMTGNASVEP